MRANSTILGSCQASLAAFDSLGSRLATGQDSMIMLWHRDTEANAWLLSADITTDSVVTQLRWAPLLYGNLLASGHDSGVICLHEEANIGGEVWKTAAKCNGSNRAAIEVLEFAPPEQGLCLASASSSHMRIYGRTDAAGWGLASQFDAAGTVTALSWRPHEPGTPAMLLVASDEGSAAIWAHQGGFNCWQKLVELGDGGDQAASAVCWAPLTGRPVDTVAIGVGNAVSLWDVTTNADGVQAEIVATLDIASPVRQVQWNSLGNWLAVTDASSVQLWRPIFGAAGAWAMLSRVGTRPPDGDVDAFGGDSIDVDEE